MLTIEEIKKTVAEIAPKYNLKRVTLFGSRAKGTATENSDVDLIVDFPKGTSLITHISLKYDLEDLFGLSVDVISRGGITKDSLLEIEREVEIYAA